MEQPPPLPILPPEIWRDEIFAHLAPKITIWVDPELKHSTSNSDGFLITLKIEHFYLISCRFIVSFIFSSLSNHRGENSKGEKYNMIEDYLWNGDFQSLNYIGVRFDEGIIGKILRELDLILDPEDHDWDRAISPTLSNEDILQKMKEKYKPYVTIIIGPAPSHAQDPIANEQPI